MRSQKQTVVYYSPFLINMYGPFLLSLILEHCPGWIIDETR